VKAAATSALVAIVALAAGCEIVGGIKRRPLAGGGGGTGGAAVGHNGSPCSSTSARACEGNNSTQKLLCNGTVWSGNGECATGERCDTRAGSTAGTCVGIVSACERKQPHDLVCVGGVVHSCGPDLITTDFAMSCADPAAPDCSAGACTCLGTRCDGICAHFDSDANNCGGCGKKCPGACAGAICQPIVLVPSIPGTITGIAVDATYVYWTTSNPGNVTKMARDGSGGPVALATDQGATGGIAIDGANAYWISSPRGVMKVDLGGLAAPIPLQLALASSVPTPIVVRGSTLVWLKSSAGGATDGGVWSAATDGSGAASIGSYGSTCAYDNAACALVADDADIFWGANGMYLMRLGTSAFLATVVGGSNFFALSATHVYWAGGGGVYRVARSGGMPDALQTSSTASSVAVDRTYLYYGDESGVHRMPRDGGAAVLVAPAPPSPPSPSVTNIVLDEVNIYWSTSAHQIAYYPKNP